MEHQLTNLEFMEKALIDGTGCHALVKYDRPSDCSQFEYCGPSVVMQAASGVHRESTRIYMLEHPDDPVSLTLTAI